MPIAMATAGQLVPPRSRGRYQSLITAMAGAAAIIGPAAGGLIVDVTSWRWIFYVNLPVGGVAAVLIASTMPDGMQRREHSFDYLGATLLATGTGAGLLGLVLGGVTYPWLSPQVLVARCRSIGLLTLFVVAERHVSEPILPWQVLRDRVPATSVVSQAIVAMCMYGSIAFVPLFLQGVAAPPRPHRASCSRHSCLARSARQSSRASGSRAPAGIARSRWSGRSCSGRECCCCPGWGSRSSRATAARDVVVAGVGIGLRGRSSSWPRRMPFPTRSSLRPRRSCTSRARSGNDWRSPLRRDHQPEPPERIAQRGDGRAPLERGEPGRTRSRTPAGVPRSVSLLRPARLNRPPRSRGTRATSGFRSSCAGGSALARQRRSTLASRQRS